MPDTTIAPYGSWDSPLTAELVAAGRISLGEIEVDAETVYTVESELYFYGRIFGFTPAGKVEPVPIDNL